MFAFLKNIVDVSPLLLICIVNTFSHSGLPFHSSNCVSRVTDLLKFNIDHSSIFSFSTFVSRLNCFFNLPQDHEYIFLCYLLVIRFLLTLTYFH